MNLTESTLGSMKENMAVLLSELASFSTSKEKTRENIRRTHLLAGQMQEFVCYILNGKGTPEFSHRASETGIWATKCALMASSLRLVPVMNARNVEMFVNGSDEAVIRDMTALLEYVGPQSGLCLREAIAKAHYEYAENH